MKKIVFLAVIISVFSSGVCLADIYNSALQKSPAFVAISAPGYVQYYDIDAKNITARFKPLTDREEKALTGMARETYKKAKKIEKAVSEGNYAKALKEDTEFLPVHIESYNYHVGRQDYSAALNEMISIKRVNSVDRVLDEDAVSYKLGMLFYLNKNYSAALTYLKGFAEHPNPSEDNLWYALADIYFNQGKFAQSISSANKIPQTSKNYIPVQEILYQDFYNIGDVSKAEECAEKLVKYKPSAQNYIRLVEVSGADDKQKSEWLNRAKAYAMTSSDETSLLLADAWKAKIEQRKIDNAAAKLTGYVEKPDWSKIYNEISSIIKPLELSSRQEQFFQSTNACIAQYAGEDLKRCFEHVNREQDKLTQQLLFEYRQAYEEQLRELQELQRQQQFIQQTYFERMYMDDFFYMKHPYFFGYW